MPIKILDPQIVSRIAAGEVVERPASVVKELVENSLDAAASQIAIEVKGGGVSLIRLTDNGVGIPPEEVALAFQRYATSKIASLDDLATIATLGFRGEALPSIAAVAQVDILTSTRDQPTGSYLSLQDGAVVQRSRQGRSAGTTITVRQLFRNVPARLKFLKSAATENSHIAHVVSQYALAFPEVKFTLSLDDRTVFRTPGTGQLINSVIEVYGTEIARSLLEIGRDQEWAEGTATPIAITGLAGSPTVSRSSRNYLSFFVNRRWINSRLLAWAVEEAYHGLLMSGKHPLAIINISLRSQEVDINIHPTKTEVKFGDEHRVFRAVQQAVRRALLALAPIPKIEELALTYTPPARGEGTVAIPTAKIEASASWPAEARPTPAFSLPALRLLGQLLASYIVAEGPDGLYLIDQHAAHERILFEQIKPGATPKVEIQGLLEPASIEINPRQEATLQSHEEHLAEFGFALEPFGPRTYLVRTVPALLQKKDWLSTLRELLDAPSGEGPGDWREKVARTIACHSAVRAGQVLTDEEMRELLRQLEKTALPNTCPHGRPTMTRLTSGQLAREFGRS